jgi:hypothetical protein
MPPMMYEIEITCFEPEPVTMRANVSSATEAEAMTRERDDGTSYVLVARHEGEVSWGDVHLWLAGDRALVRCDEHREWHACDPAWAEVGTASEVWFIDSDGTPFPAAGAETVSRAQAFAALAYWLRTGGMLPTLRWA